MAEAPPARTETLLRNGAPLAALLATYVLLAVAYQHHVPLFEAPDEPSHLQYVAFLSVEGRLPVDGERPDVPGEGMQAPLYYLLGVPLLRASVDDEAGLLRELHRSNLSTYRYAPRAGLRNREVRHVRTPREPWRFVPNPRLSSLRNVRGLSLAFGLLAVVLTYLAVLGAVCDRTLALTSAALLGLNPQFLFASSYVNNDTAATAVGAATFLIVARALRERAGERFRLYLCISLLIGVGLFTKVSTLVGLAVAGLTVFFLDARPLRRRFADAARTLGPLLLAVSPYLAWNAVSRGDPLGLSAVWQSSSHLATHEAFGGVATYFSGMYWELSFESYWGRFGWLNVPCPGPVYAVFLGLTGAGLLGFARSAWVTRSFREVSRPRALRLYLATVIAANLAAHIWFNLDSPQPQGRHLFPAAPEIACAVALGLAGLTGGPADRLPSWAAGSVIVMLLGLACYALLGVIAPAYA